MSLIGDRAGTLAGADDLGRARVALGAIFLIRTTPLLGAFHVPFLADTHPLLGWPHDHARLTPLLSLLPAVWLAVLCVARTVAAVAFTAGVMAGPAGLVAGVLGYVTVTQDPGRLNTTQHVIFLGTMLLAMSDATSRCALFPARARDLRSSHLMMRFWIASIYFWAGLSKLRPDWLDGRALVLFASEGLVRPSLAAVLLSTPVRRAVVGSAVAIGELTIAPLLLARRTRRFGVIAALGLHATFEIAVSPDLFGWAMAALLLGCWGSGSGPPHGGHIAASARRRGSATATGPGAGIGVCDDFDAGVVMVSRSHDRDIPKGGRVEAVPITEELVPYLKKAMTASPSELVFPNDDGTMLPKHTALEHVLRRAMRRAGLVTGYVHKCRRQGCGHQEPAPNANPIDCPKCEFRLFPVGQVRTLRLAAPFTTRPRKGACSVDSTRNR